MHGHVHACRASLLVVVGRLDPLPELVQSVEFMSSNLVISLYHSRPFSPDISDKGSNIVVHFLR
jgi:hypothetical protein